MTVCFVDSDDFYRHGRFILALLGFPYLLLNPYSSPSFCCLDPDYSILFLPIHGKPRRVQLFTLELNWGERWGLNPRPPEPQSGALPTELRSPRIES